MTLKTSFMMLMQLSVSAPSWAIHDKVIYGQDGRLPVSEVSGKLAPLVERVSAAVAMQVESSLLRSPEPQPTQLHARLRTFGEARNMCPGERFADAPVLGRCSGFLVGPKLLLTAGHCVRGVVSCTTTKWVFDFRADRLKIQKGEGQAASVATILASNVYSCQKIIRRAYDREIRADFALIELDRPVEGRTPLAYRTEGAPSKGDGLLVVGHPSGMPQMAAIGAHVRDIGRYHVLSNLDAFQGNSGSPVVNTATGLVEGVLVSGEVDLDLDPELKCNRSHQCDDDGCDGEGATRMSAIPELVPGGDNAEIISMTSPLPPVFVTPAPAPAVVEEDDGHDDDDDGDTVVVESSESGTEGETSVEGDTVQEIVEDALPDAAPEVEIPLRPAGR